MFFNGFHTSFLQSFILARLLCLALPYLAASAVNAQSCLSTEFQAGFIHSFVDGRLNKPPILQALNPKLRFDGSGGREYAPVRITQMDSGRLEAHFCIANEFASKPAKFELDTYQSQAIPSVFAGISWVLDEAAAPPFAFVTSTFVAFDQTERGASYSIAFRLENGQHTTRTVTPNASLRWRVPAGQCLGQDTRIFRMQLNVDEKRAVLLDDQIPGEIALDSSVHMSHQLVQFGSIDQCEGEMSFEVQLPSLSVSQSDGGSSELFVLSFTLPTGMKAAIGENPKLLDWNLSFHEAQVRPHMVFGGVN